MVIPQLFQQLVFLAFAAVLIISALMVVLSGNPVRSALFLVLAFFASAGLWLLVEVEFLALVLIIVYVGAVMTLFLFVIMTLNPQEQRPTRTLLIYLPYALIIVALVVGIACYVVSPEHFAAGVNASQHVVPQPADYSNTKALGSVLYTDYVYPFELAGILLLLAIVAAITLTFRGKQINKSPSPEQQININVAQRIRLVNRPAKGKSND